jgi:DNA invertase Pin-like site-specific DNA recombinase
VTEAIDTTTPGGRLVFHIFGALAEFERSIIRERTRAGLDAARSRGKIGGRPKKLSEGDLRAAKAMLLDGGITVAQIAKQLGVSQATLYRYLPSARSMVTES